MKFSPTRMITSVSSNLMSETQDFQYAAGSCNIGPKEIRRRKFVGFVGLVLVLITIASFHSQHVKGLSRVSVFLPAMLFSIGYLQSRKKFCLAFGLAGLFNFGSLGQVSKVISPADKAFDRKAALNLIVQSLGLSSLITVIVLVLPV